MNWENKIVRVSEFKIKITMIDQELVGLYRAEYGNTLFWLQEDTKGVPKLLSPASLRAGNAIYREINM